MYYRCHSRLSQEMLEVQAAAPGTATLTVSFTGTGTATNYNCSTYVSITAWGVEKIVVSCPYAETTPLLFEGGKTDFGDPSDEVNPGKALVVFRDQVIDQLGNNVIDFDITLVANIHPDSISAGLLNSINWSKVFGPNSGIFDSTGAAHVRFQSPSKGGLYKFEFNLGVLDCPKSGANVLLPLAGANMTSWLVSEISTIRNWGENHRKTVLAENDSAIPLVTQARVLRTWIEISANRFDYYFDPVNADQTAPCRRFFQKGALYNYVTVNGVVIHSSKINNMLWAIFGRSWGYETWELMTGAHYNQIRRTGHMDNGSSQVAITLGCYIYDHPLVGVSDALTPTLLKAMQDTDYLIEERLWPSTDEADVSKSIFIRPNLPVKP